jgi:uncharacterized protein
MKTLFKFSTSFILTFALALLALIALFSMNVHAQFSPAEPGEPQAKLRTITLTIDSPKGAQKVIAEVADTPQALQTGMMHRKSMGKNEGMAFVFPEIAYHGMWMKNTLIPLSVAFITEDGTIQNIREMQALHLDPHAASGPVRYALEMNAKWFEERGIKAGAKVKGLPPVKK